MNGGYQSEKFYEPMEGHNRNHKCEDQQTLIYAIDNTFF